MAGYITLDELETLGIQPEAIARFSDTQKQAAIAAASDEADAYIRQVAGVPLATAPLALKTHVAKMAVFQLLSARGMDPEADKLVIDNYERAIRFLTAIAKGVVLLGGLTPPDEVPEDVLEQPLVLSDEPRGI